MNPPNDRSIRNIPVPKSHQRRPQLPPDTYEEDFTQPPPQRKKVRITSFFGNRFAWIAAGIIVFCTALGFLFSTVFAGATITITPRTAAVTVPPSVVAQPNASPGGLAYQVVSTSRSASTTVTANGTQNVSRAATGILTVYNEYSAESQRLIPNTRFEAPDGQIYKIKDAVTVPGTKKNADGTTAPGSVTVSAYANSPGESYNRGETRFTIPGFKNDPRYSKFYATTGEMSGGFVGQEVAIAPEDLQKAKDLLKQSLEEALRAGAQTQIPKEYLVIPGTLTIAYGNVTQTLTEGGRATIAQTASATANIVRYTDLAAAVARNTVQGYQGEAVGFVDESQIAVAVNGTSTNATGPLTLMLSGNPTLKWLFDPNQLKKALVGKNKSAFEEVVQTFSPAIQCTSQTPCKASVRPFWSGAFPSDESKITIKTAGY